MEINDRLDKLIVKIKKSKEAFILAPFFILSALLLFAVSSFGDQSQHKSFLWKVQSKTTTVYLLGSIHVLRKDFYPLAARIENAFDESKTLVVEANINNVDIGATLSMLQGSLYQGDDTIENHLSKDTFDLVSSRLKELGMPMELFLKNKPWFVAVTITALELGKLGFDPGYGIDKHFLDEADGKKKILELESAKYQMDLLNNLSDEDQELFLVYTMKELDMLRQEMDTMTDAWKSGDAKAMDSIISGQLRDEPGLSRIYGRLIYERNRNMASKIEDYLKSGGKYFVVVGAAHLVGERGILERLKARGYSVEQM